MDSEKKAKLQEALKKAYEKMNMSELIETRESLMDNVRIIDDIIKYRAGCF
jgi:uncharacterized membrane protein YqiK